MNIDEWLKNATHSLGLTEVPSARLDALILLEDALQKDRSWLLAHQSKPLPANILKRLNRQIERRAKHEPLAYIRGFTEFYGRNFKLNSHVLEPRPESEPMIELLLEFVAPLLQLQSSRRLHGANEQRTELYKNSTTKEQSQLATKQAAEKASGATGSAGRQAGLALSIADVGTGCGALGITAALEIPSSSVDLYDIDSSALAVARHNSILHELQLHAYKRDLLNKVSKVYDAILANLPYVPSSWDINRAASHEPIHAIRGGEDGLDYYRRLFVQMSKRPHLARFVLAESLPTQHVDLEEIAKDNGYRLVQTRDFIQLFEAV